MMRCVYFFVSILWASTISGQMNDQSYSYAPSSDHPFGQVHPEAPDELSDYAPLIGTNICQSVSRIDQNTWADTVAMTWTFKYIMNGMAVQDETLKADGRHSGSIRQFNPDSARWYVHYYSSTASTPVLSSWEGNKQKEQIILYREQKSPNGMDGFYRLTFSDIDHRGFNWAGEWVSLDESFVYPTWRIFCTKLE